MGRIRTIKPEFPQSESIGRLSRDARLCFIQLWTQADDEGRLRGSSRMLASLLYPYDDDAGGLIECWLAELESQGHIARYSVQGNCYIQVTKFLEHQKIDKPSPSKLPSLAKSREASTITREASPQYLVSSIKDQVSGPVSGNGHGGITPEMLARGLGDNLHIALGSGPGSLFTALIDVGRSEEKDGRNLEEVAVEMEAAYRYYEQEKPNLRIQWGLAKFFGEGHWRNPDGWPRKAKARGEEISEWRAPDDEK